MDVEKVFTLISELKQDNIEIKDELRRKASEAKIDELIEEIRLKDEKIAILESKNMLLEKAVKSLESRSEANEQYSRRLCLRVSIPVKEDAPRMTSETCLEEMSERFVSAGLSVPDYALDRSHPIGKSYVDDNGVRRRTLICKFTSWCYRTLVYRARKSFPKGTTIRLDLTKERLKLLKDAQVLIKDNTNFKYVFADVNCSLGIRLADDSLLHFSSLSEVEKIVAENQ